MPTVSQDEYAAMFRTCSDAFRIEAQPTYLTSPAEAGALAAFLAGSPKPPSAFPVWQSWLDQVRAWTDQGKTIARVRIIDTPPTDYQRWSSWCARWHIDAGEVIRYMSRETADALGIPRGDWQLFDGRRLVRMEFTPEGRPLRKTLVTDPSMLPIYRMWRDNALKESTPPATIPI